MICAKGGITDYWLLTVGRPNLYMPQLLCIFHQIYELCIIICRIIFYNSLLMLCLLSTPKSSKLCCANFYIWLYTIFIHSQLCVNQSHPLSIADHRIAVGWIFLVGEMFLKPASTLRGFINSKPAVLRMICYLNNIWSAEVFWWACFINEQDIELLTNCVEQQMGSSQ